MATWSAFTHDGATMRDFELTTFEDHDIVEVKQQKYDTAKKIVMHDLESASGYKSTDADFEQMLDDFAEPIRTALIFKQLHLYFTDNDKGADSVARYKANMYDEQYQSMRTQFTSFTNSVNAQRASRRVLSR